jgi:cyclopropane fatty-acyl-phospholipid synthase-like methyltransferase
MSQHLSNPKFQNFINDYYSQKFKEFGPTPQGVDWNGQDSQHARFEKLLKHTRFEPSSTILDYGCGYGELFTYLNGAKSLINYTGFDLVEESIEKAKLHHQDTQASFVSTLPENLTWDYIVLSGVFNVKGNYDEDEWRSYVISEINTLLRKANKGLSFNMLTVFNDKHLRRDHLFYADPTMLMTMIEILPPYCVVIDHSYPMWEFTVTILK